MSDKKKKKKKSKSKAERKAFSFSESIKEPKKAKKIRPPRFLWLSQSLENIRLPKIHINWTKRHTRILIIILSLLVIILGTVVAISSTYTVDNITVEGNTHYTYEEISDMVLGDGVLSRNSLYLSLKYANKDIKDIPFIETMKVRITSPTSIKITVYEKAIAGFVEYMGKYIYFDNDGTVVESSDSITEGVPQIVGMDFDHFVMYEPLPVENPDIFAQILDASQLLEKYEIDVDKIYFDEDYNITLYFGDARVKLGDFDSIDEKIIRLKAILPELEGKKGVLKLENYTSEDEITTFEYDK